MGFPPDQQMYTASQYEFRSFPDIRRNSPPPTLKTEDAPTRWLNGGLIPSNNKSPFDLYQQYIIVLLLIAPILKALLLSFTLINIFLCLCAAVVVVDRSNETSRKGLEGTS